MKVLIFFGAALLYALAASADNNDSIEPNKTQYFCQHERCLTCVGRHCATTCRGKECPHCPKGDCCDGSNCNICRRTACCTTRECNICVNSCIKECFIEPSCNYECFKKCLPDSLKQRIAYEIDFLNRRKYLPFNVTTVINITNTVTNKNAVFNPVSVNASNPQTYSVNTTRIKYANPFKRITETPIIAITSNHKCCEIVHPEMCFNISGNPLCYTRKHKECSNLCKSNVVHIIRPKGSHYNNTIIIASYPYFYYGNYATENCASCYNCPNMTPTECSLSSNCSHSCRSSIKSNYNKVYTTTEPNLALKINLQ